jgi:two-component system response regulator FixJ
MNSPPATDPARRFVCIVEDDAAVRESLTLLLRLRGYEPITFESAEQFLAGSALDRPACVLLDVRLPGISGLELQQRLKGERPALPVIVMTAHGDAATARAALRDGAIDFLEKPVDEADLLEAVEAALQTDLAQLVRDREHENILVSLQRLTERELDVFERITDGLHNREIAEELGISPRTVEVHRARLMEKLSARRVADLFRLRFELDRRAPDRAQRALGKSP